MHVSCFEIFVNCIYDLLKLSAESDTESNISSHYVESMAAATSLLQKGLQKRKVGYMQRL